VVIRKLRKLFGRPGSEPPIGVETILDRESLLALNFYQLKNGTAEFFLARLGRDKVRIADTPHFAFAEALATGSPEAQAEGFYRDYLLASWGPTPDEALERRIADFRDTFAHYRANGFAEPPVLTALPTDPNLYVVDGNHRTAMAAALGRELRAVIWPAEQAFRKFTRVKEFYGTDNKDMPYQSIVLHGQEVIAGRRDDLRERLDLLPPEVLAGKSVLDVACNVGMSALIARSLGAAACLGLERSSAMVDLATRFAMFEGVYPAVSFRAFDLDKDALEPDAAFDTAFMFSIHDHLEDPSRLGALVAGHVRHHVVFEGHPSGQAEDYAAFLRSGLFRQVEEIGRLHQSRFKRDSSRILWLCTR
jgi:SAM-dependent methyltransferase